MNDASPAAVAEVSSAGIQALASNRVEDRSRTGPVHRWARSGLLGRMLGMRHQPDDTTRQRSPIPAIERIDPLTLSPA